MPELTTWRLFRTFLALGCTAFGGPAIIVYLRDTFVVRRGWVKPETFDDGIGLCQSIPGATGMQLAAYLGLRMGGVCGALAAFTGFGIPAFLFMVALSALYHRTHDIPAILAMFTGLQAVVIALVANAAWSFSRDFVKYRRDILLALCAALLLGYSNAPFLAIPVSALAGLYLYGHVGDEVALTGVAAPCAKRAHAWRAAALLVGVAFAGMVVLFVVDPPLFALAATMMRIDLLAFGGGYASVPLMLHEVVFVRHWVDGPTFMDGIALGQITPGPIVVTATFVGFLRAGIIGAVVATGGIFLPSLILLLVTAPEFHRLQRHPVVRRALRGAIASFVGLLFVTTIRLAVHVPWNTSLAAIAFLAFIALLLRARAPVVILCSAVAAWLLH